MGTVKRRGAGGSVRFSDPGLHFHACGPPDVAERDDPAVVAPKQRTDMGTGDQSVANDPHLDPIGRGSLAPESRGQEGGRGGGGEQSGETGLQSAAAGDQSREEGIRRAHNRQG